MPERRLKLAIQRPWSDQGAPDDLTVQAWVETTLGDQHAPAELLIRIVGEQESRRLNRQYRGKDRPTNVLSFPMELPPGVPNKLLGDLVICAPVVQREAMVQGKQLHAHWAHIVVHGVLHLLGYDHLGEAQAQIMEHRETCLLMQMGFADPYVDCADA